MGCFFGCFRIKEDNRPKTHLVSKSIASNNRELLVSKHQLASVFLCEEKGHLSLQENFDRDGGDDDGGLKQEAKFLKSCGALLETPSEIRKASEKTTAEFLHGDSIRSNSHSWLPNTSCKKLNWDEHQAELIHDALIEAHENSGSSENKSGGGDSDEHQTLRKTLQLEGGKHACTDEQGMDSVALDDSPSQTDNQISPPGRSASPYPTPLNLSEEMQTPRTVYPVKLDNHRTGRTTGIRTQYVYPVLNPVENLSQWKAVKEEHPCQFVQVNIQVGQQKEISSPHVEKPPEFSLTPMARNSSLNGTRSQNEETVSSRAEVDLVPETPKLIVSSLSQWLKPSPPKDTNNISKERSHSDRSPDADRPIIGIVAAHWKDEEPSRVSPKWFDGNGIPNSTNKYKEDQKVSWHATPFEERLEKALSDEKLYPQRKLHNGRLIALEDEGEESDTAAS